MSEVHSEPLALEAQSLTAFATSSVAVARSVAAELISYSHWVDAPPQSVTACSMSLEATPSYSTTSETASVHLTASPELHTLTAEKT